jgi:enoyl-CoA hydratase/carnithine racemase
MNRLAVAKAFRPIAPELRTLWLRGCTARTYTSLVQVTDEAVCRRISMSNLKQRNSLGIEMIRALQAAVDSTNLERCRVLVLGSLDDKIFSAGHNLKELTTEKGAELHTQVFAEFTRLCLGLQQLPVPVIAEVKGTQPLRFCFELLL